MTELRHACHRLLVLHFDEISCALDASELVAIDHDGESARLAFHGPLRDLSEYLPRCSSSEPPVRLIAHIDGARRAFRVQARIELVETSLLYRMPHMLRDCGCAPWLRGIALLDGSDHADPGIGHKRPAFLLDLVRLADGHGGRSTNQKELA